MIRIPTQIEAIKPKSRMRAVPLIIPIRSRLMGNYETGMGAPVPVSVRSPRAPPSSRTTSTAEVIPIPARSERDAVLAHANAIIAEWIACTEARSIAIG
jgi:hypothetical protein